MTDIPEADSGSNPMWSSTTTTDGGHAKAELALRFLEHISLLHVDKLGKKRLDAIEVVADRCWILLDEYFKP